MATPVPPAVAGHEPWILGIDVGGTKVAVVAGTLAGGVTHRHVHAAEARHGFEHMWGRLTLEADALVSALGAPALVGVSIGGPLEHARGVILSPPNLPGWDGIPLGHLLQQRYRVPVHVEHDAKAGLLAEWYFGAARGCADAVFLTLGTGIGCGILAGGTLIRGSGDMAGEIGHWRMARRGPRAYGKVGSLEAYASGSGIAQLARRRSPARWPLDVSAADVVTAARAGDSDAGAIVREASATLGLAIAQLLDLLDPEVVVLGALGWRAADLVLPVVHEVVGREALPRPHPARIVPAELGESLGDVAALAAAIHHGGLGPRHASAAGPG